MPGKTKTSASKAKKSSAKKTKPVVETPVETPVEEVSPAPVQETSPDEVNYDEDFSTVYEQLTAAMTTIKTLTSMVKSLEKRVARDRKVMNKKLKGRAKRVVDPNKPPSGFAKPGPVSDELRSFLGLGKDELIAKN